MHLRQTGFPAFLTLAAALSSAAPTAAQSPQGMLDECSEVAQDFFREAARTEMRYNGQRTDGTHAVGGRIFLENRYADFSCSFASDRRRMVEFFADGQPHNEVLGGNGSSSDVFVRVEGVPPGDVLNMREGPSAGDRIVGALANGDEVRQVQCSSRGSSTWCEIEQQDDMRSRGWVNARYLRPLGAAAGAGGGSLDHGSPVENRCAAAVAREVGVSPDDVVVTNSTISEATGLQVIYVGVPNAQADWICEADADGRVVRVFYSGESPVR